MNIESRTKSALCFGLVLAFALLTGCKTADYKAAGVVVVTAERASDGWLDYYVSAKKRPGADLDKLRAQDGKVRLAWEDYQRSMETIYVVRKAISEGILPPATLEQKISASVVCAQAVVSLVFEFLPVNERKRLTLP